MASLTLGVAGSVIGGALGGPIGAAVGGAIGSAAGGYIDSTLIMPALFRSDTPNIGKQSLSGFSIQNRDEGSPINLAIGHRVRVEGTLIWADAIREVKTSRSSGGKGGGGGQKANVYNYFRSMAVALCHGPIDKIVRIYADSKIIYDRGVTDERIAQLHLYTGETNQSANAYIQSKVGTADTPAYRGICYFVIEDLALRDFGNRIPNFTAVVEANTEMTLGEAVEVVMDRCGFDPTEYDVSELNACFDGVKIPGPQTGIEMLEPLMLFHNIIVADQNGVLRFTHRTSTPETEVPVADLGFRSGKDRSVEISVADISETSIPSEVSVTFVDRSREFQPGSVSDSLRSFNVPNIKDIKVPLTMHNGQARALARRVLYSAAAERQEVTLVLPPRYMNLSEGDVLTFTLNGANWRLRLSSVVVGSNKQVRVTGITEQLHVHQYADFDEDVSNFLPGAYTPPPVEFAVFDAPPVNSSQLDEPGVYFGITPSNPDDTFLGGTMFVSEDNVDYLAVESLSSAPVFGRTLNKLKGPKEKTEIGWAVWDESTTFKVEIWGGELSSATADAVYRGNNLLVVGKEVVGFRTATLYRTLSNGTKRYELSGLLRGRRGTEGQMYSHGEHDKILLLNRDSPFGRLELTDRGVTRYFKGVPVGGDTADYDEIQATLDFVNLRPFSVANLKVQFTTTINGDHVFTWSRRTRVPYNVFSPNIAPVGEGSELYTIELVTTSGAVKSLFTVSSPNYTLTYTQRVNAGLSGSYFFRVYQMSSKYGRGALAQVKVLY